MENSEATDITVDEQLELFRACAYYEGFCEAIDMMLHELAETDISEKDYDYMLNYGEKIKKINEEE